MQVAHLYETVGIRRAGIPGHVDTRLAGYGGRKERGDGARGPYQFRRHGVIGRLRLRHLDTCADGHAGWQDQGDLDLRVILPEKVGTHAQGRPQSIDLALEYRTLRAQQPGMFPKLVGGYVLGHGLALMVGDLK